MNENPTNAEEQYKLGLSYAKGDGVPKDQEKANSWFTKAAEQGYADAQYELGNRLKDYTAVDWLTKAAEQGNTDAMKRLGDCYRWGGGITAQQDPEKSKYWYNKAEKHLSEAATHGDAKAMYKLSSLYRDACYHFIGYDTKARDLLITAANSGYSKAQGSLGFALQYGTFSNLKKDIKAAKSFYTAAALQGDASAQYELGTNYINGIGCKKDLEEGISWLTKSAEQGYYLAQYELGLNYYRGRGVPKDLEKSKHWIALAAESYSDAKKVLDRLNAGKSPEPISGCLVFVLVIIALVLLIGIIRSV